MSTNVSGQDIDLGSLWSGVRKALPVIMVFVLAAGFLTFALVSMMAPRYEAEAQLTITAKRSNPYGGSKNDAGAAAAVTPRLDPAAINTHVRALMAPDLLLKVAGALNLAQRAEFNSAVGPVDTLDTVKSMLGLGRRSADDGVETRVLGAMQKNLSVSAARESRFITVRFRSTDPQIAADVANMIAKSYRETLREIPVRETNEAVAALLPKIEKLSSEVLETEAEAKRFRAETDQLTGGGIQSLTLQQQRLSTLSADLVRAEGERAKSESRLQAAQELLAGGSANTLPEVQNSRIIQDLISQRVRVERQVNEARAVLLYGHPRMRQLNADLAGLRRSISRETRTIVNSISKEVRLSQLRTEQLRNQVAGLKKVAVARSGDEAKLRSLEAIAKSKRNELERLQKQLEDNRTVVDTNRVPVESTIVSAARADQDAVFPKKGPFTLLAMAAAFMLGLFLVIARGLLAIGRPAPQKRAETPAQAPARAALSGSLRARAGEAPASASAGAASAMSGYVRQFLRGPKDPSGFRLLIAGADQNVDPSDEAIELATELSEAGGRVLLVDWTMNGQPLLGDVDVGRAGSIADLIADKARFEDILTPLSDTNVQYAYTSRSPASKELSDERGLNLVLDACDEVYDQVIVFGRHDDAAALFETIEGRFDAGMVIFDEPVRGRAADKTEFLGFDVAEINIIHHVRSNGAAKKRVGRMLSN